ncbi:Smr/MutS family protein [Rubrivirga sp.]|uniref:Smr/MutS family protein n=1 Tax=Rubrivirga sp. TaxID=1885344 RepID=UPI003C71AE37
MPTPTLDDDGTTVTLDLHGATVDDALRLTDAAIVEAARHGRTTIRVIHGASTTDAGAHRTIKTALLDALEDGEYDRHVTTDVRMEGMMILGLAPAPSPARDRMRLSDLR